MMYTFKHFILILLLISVFFYHKSEGNGCSCSGKYASSNAGTKYASSNEETKNAKKSTDTIASKSNVDDSGNYYLVKNECYYKPRAVAKTIKPYKSVQEYVPKFSFANMCLKCAACLAVTDELGARLKTLKDKFGKIYYDEFKEMGGAEELRNLCRFEFQNYDLRKYEDNTFLGPITPSTSHVSTDMDGQWTRSLRYLCNSYLDHFNETNLFSIYKEANNINITDYICKGRGIFRDCQNVDYYLEEIPVTNQASSFFKRNSEEKMCVKCI